MADLSEKRVRLALGFFVRRVFLPCLFKELRSLLYQLLLPLRDEIRMNLVQLGYFLERLLKATFALKSLS
ncbi:MAG: hypothetical protein NT080_10405 [Spirochaetes bacterium]|nr:hypothetical protein [Spirochaetota bacterium]